MGVVTLENGTTFTGDLIIGADGVHVRLSQKHGFDLRRWLIEPIVPNCEQYRRR